MGVIEDLGLMKDVTALPLIMQILQDKSEYDWLRVKAAGALANIGDPAGADILIKVIVEEAGMLFHGDVVTAATESLGELCEISPETVQKVVETLAIPEASERAKFELIQTLVDVNHPLAFKTLAEFAASEVEDIRDYAVFGLARMVHTRDAVILNALRAALNDPDEDIRQQAKQALNNLDAEGD